MDREAFAAAFDTGFIARAPHIGIRPEAEADRAFLFDLFAATYPWADAMPSQLVEMQAQSHNAHCRAAYPAALYRILMADQIPIGRIALDWVPGDHTMGVDIALRPEHAGTGVGSAMLRAWIDLADRDAIPCRCTARADNPARQIYARLGFVALPGGPDEAMVKMERPVGR